MLNQEEYAMYQKAVDYILRNLNNPDFNQILRQNGYKIIPCKLSYVIENLEKAGYIVSKPEVDTSIQPSTQTFNKNAFFKYKQCIENNNKDLLKQYSYEYLNQSYNINICIKNE